MTKVVLGPTGSRRRRRTLLAPFFLAALVALALTSGAQAVHHVGVFQLDGNGSTAVQSSPAAAEDWDLICKAHPTTCTFAPGYAIPSGTTVAKPSQHFADPSQSQQDDILKGGTKDDNDISSWKWASAKPSPPKNDITHAYAAEYTCKGTADNSVAACSGATGDKLLYFGADRFSDNGSANIAFWFFQNKITQRLADGVTDAGPTDTCSLGSGCIFGGVHKEGKVPHDPNNVGDILIISAFGPHAQIQVYEWVGVGKAPANQCVNNACSLVRLIPASAGQACEDVTVDNACATVNGGPVASPWTVKQSSGPDNQFLATNFFEGGLNMTALGLDKACFSSFLVNTRASASVDAELHDKVLGQFDRCVGDLTTQASTNGEVQPGTAVTDTATVTITGATSPPDPVGTVQFYLCGPIATGGCESTSNPIGNPVNLVGGANTTDGTATAVSPSVNDVAESGNRGPLAVGRYCFRAKADLTNYDDPDEFTDDTNECFSVAKIPTTTTTTPGTLVSTTFTPITSVAVNTQVVDRAIVAGTAAGGAPTGTVDFFVCSPSQLDDAGTLPNGDPDNPNTCDIGGTSAGAGVSLAALTATTSRAFSNAVTVNAVGTWCFRAVYSGSLVYLGSSDASTGECFTVTDSTSGTSQQTWVPNDSATVTSTGGIALNGTLRFRLIRGSCDPAVGTVVYEDDGNPNLGGIQPHTLSNAASPATRSTSNSTFSVNVNNDDTYWWRVEFAPTSSFVTGFTKCERTDITINDNPS